MLALWCTGCGLDRTPSSSSARSADGNADPATSAEGSATGSATGAIGGLDPDVVN
ncbi:MAG: hypothetical protein PVI30_15210 [Myxococcales bacterium]